MFEFNEVPESSPNLPILRSWAAAENLLVFGGGAFLPLGFNDGSTLLHWWPKRGAVG